MPVPALSLDLVRLVVEHLEADHLHCSTATREAGLALALVCKSWRSIGLALIWRFFFVALDEDRLPRLKTLVKAGVGRPLIKHLHLYDTNNSAQTRARGTFMQCEVSDEALELVKEFVGGCTSLQSLVLKVFSPSATGATIEAVLSSLASPYFTHLFLGCADYPAFSAPAFIQLLANLPTLRKLDAMMLISSVSVNRIEPSQSVVLSLKTMELNFASIGSGDGSTVALRALAKCLDRTSLRKCLVHMLPSQTFFVGSLTSCTNLSALRLTFEDSAKIREALPALLPILPRFSSLEDLQIGVKDSKLMEESADLPSPVSTRAFLAALPPTLHAVLLSGVFLLWSPDDFLPSLPIQRFQAFLDVAKTTLLCFGAASGGRVERAMLAKVKLPGAAEAVWCRLC
ncbi:hypothetical protein JCM10213_002255 [Rhodosporidiobolus nylandii]